jgi:hypothetical protein
VNPYKIFVKNFQERGLLRDLDVDGINIKTGLGPVGSKNLSWTKLAQDSVQWGKAVLNILAS